MTRTRLVWLIIVVLVALTLGGASWIVANNPGGLPTGASPGFVH